MSDWRGISTYQHAHDWDECDQLAKSPKDEKKTPEHLSDKCRDTPWNGLSDETSLSRCRCSCQEVFLPTILGRKCGRRNITIEKAQIIEILVQRIAAVQCAAQGVVLYCGTRAQRIADRTVGTLRSSETNGSGVTREVNEEKTRIRDEVQKSDGWR